MKEISNIIKAIYVEKIGKKNNIKAIYVKMINKKNKD